jgi:hypothetical protein
MSDQEEILLREHELEPFEAIFVSVLPNLVLPLEDPEFPLEVLVGKGCTSSHRAIHLEGHLGLFPFLDDNFLGVGRHGRED